MSANSNSPFSGLDRAFHEPKRLAILSSLSARGSTGAPFTDLKDECALTDGNLNRHLKVLADSGAVKLKKVDRKGARPRTVVHLTAKGREHFIRYLDSLERALANAAKAIGRPAKEHAVRTVSSRGKAAAG